MESVVFTIGGAWVLGALFGSVFPRATLVGRKPPPFPGEWWKLPSGEPVEVTAVEGKQVHYRHDGVQRSVPRKQLEQHGSRWDGPPQLASMLGRD